MTTVRRVLFLPSWYPSPRNPVLGTFVREHARACAQQYETVVVYPFEAPRSEHTEVREEPERGPLEILVPFVVPSNRHWASYAYARAVRRVFRHQLRGWRPDVIHVHVGYPAAIAGLLAWVRWRQPVVYTEQAGPLKEKILASRPSRLAVPALARVARVGAPVSRFLEEDMRQAGILPRRSMILPNTVDLALFRPPPDGRPPRGRIRLLAVALLVPGKGLDLAVDAVALLAGSGTDASLTISGDGPLRSSLENRARQGGVSDRIRFLGLQSKAEVAALMRGHDVFVMPSDRETFSAVVIEAMASGLPVVATRSGGPEELIEPGTGLLVDVGSPHAIADAVKTIAANRTNFVKGPEVARRRFGHAAVGRRLVELYAAASR